MSFHRNERDTSHGCISVVHLKCTDQHNQEHAGCFDGRSQTAGENGVLGGDYGRQ
jgi:hypothetical protein